MPIRCYILSFIWVFILQFLTFCAHGQQLKLGNNPTSIVPSAVLELDSKNQGLLLTRISDTANIKSPPDGMIIYLTQVPNTGVYVRKDGIWQRTFNYFRVTKDPSSVKVVRTHDTISYNIPNASHHVEGVVSTTSSGQSFGGDKTFKDSLIALGGFNAYQDAEIDKNLILKALPRTNPGYLLSTDNTGKVILQTNPNDWIVGGNSLTGEKKLGLKYDDSLSFITKGKDRIRITSDGKTGVGTTDPSDMFTVNGSFKLGKGGSSFERMGEGVGTITNYLKAINVLNLLKAGNLAGPYAFTINLTGVKKNSLVILNPIDNLNTLQMSLTVNLLTSLTLPLGGTKVRIAWVRAPSDGQIEIGLLFDFSGVANLNSLSGLLNLLSLGGILTYSSDPIHFTVLYCNPI